MDDRLRKFWKLPKSIHHDKEGMMKKATFPVIIALLWLTGWQSMAVAQTIPVSQGEQITLNIKLVNVGDTELGGVHAQLDSQATPVWIHPEVRTHQSVEVPAKTPAAERPSAMLPLTFTVDKEAPEDAEASIRVLIRDGEGHLWTKVVPLKVLRPKPKASQLLQNYPNPFNPETWIPYQLAKPAHVSIQIYEPSGRLVRTLDLGHRGAGFYTSRAEAAYWDGRNETGERVSSGLYFYQLQTNYFSAMRRMVVMK
ncbi:T9SS type A sorting domain-containing protein [Candidatus Poribacteria bacterium]|nr:T9SS type A sorting domain-containing protein [Candidatus Poribacteria bacterium]